MRCLIHIGLHHTGTTSLQTLLSKNKESLAKFGISYPSSSLHGIQHSLLPGSYLPDHYALPKVRKLDPNYYVKQISDELNQKDINLCILSSEVFNELLSIKKEFLLELLGKLDDVFHDISIMITTRNAKERALSMQKAQIRASNSNKDFRKEIFNAPERFRNKLNGTSTEIKNWENIGKKLITIKMKEDSCPMKLYLETIFSQLNFDPSKQIQYYKQFEKMISNQNLRLNYDSIHSAIYILLVLIGQKIRNANCDLKDKLNLDIVIKFIDSIDIKLRNYLFLFNKINLIYFLENYDLKDYNPTKIEKTLISSGANYSTCFIILKLIDEFIYKLILTE